MASAPHLLSFVSQQLLPRPFNSLFTRIASRHIFAKQQIPLRPPLYKHYCACPASFPPSPTSTFSAAALTSKRIHIVEGDLADTGANAPVFALRLRNAKDFDRMLSASGLLCLIPANQDAATKAWQLSGEGTRCFADLREDAFYMTMSAMRLGGAWSNPDGTQSRLRTTVRQVRNELTNRALGEEGELTEAMLGIFTKKAGYPNMESKQELRIVENEEVDAVLVSTRAIAIGFHCNKLTLKEAAAAFTRVSKWSCKAHKGSQPYSFLLGKALYVVLSANYLPNKETQQVISFCKKHNLVILLRNGANFSMHNSLLPPQQIVPTKIQPTKSIS